MSKEIELQGKEDIKKLLKAKFIRPTKYVQWFTNTTFTLSIQTNNIANYHTFWLREMPKLMRRDTLVISAPLSMEKIKNKDKKKKAT